MFEQIITEKDIGKLIHKHELVEEKINNNSQKYDQVKKKIYNNISAQSFSIKVNKTHLYDKPLYTAADIESRIVLRYLDKLIKRVYKVKQANRDRIIKQLISILHSTNEFYIIKLDISSFYESVDSKKIIQRLKDDGIISYQNIKYIDEVINKTCINGLPRGIAFSSSLSELYLRKFDNYLRKHEKISFFARYVDDIIIISSEDITNEIKKFITKTLNLKINGIKKRKIYIDNKEKRIETFDFLGYKFLVERFSNKEIKERSVKITISDNKLKKIKKRIVKSSLIYLKDKDFDNLYNRIKLIFSNYQLDSNENGILMTGIYYNYKYITENSALQDINKFKYLLFHGNGRLSNLLKLNLTTQQIAKLDKLNIYYGFYLKIKIRFSEQKIIKLCQVLKYV